MRWRGAGWVMLRWQERRCELAGGDGKRRGGGVPGETLSKRGSSSGLVRAGRQQGACREQSGACAQGTMPGPRFEPPLHPVRREKVPLVLALA